MKLIDTSVISPSAGYPGLGNNPHVKVGLDFLQQAALDNAAALSQALASDPSLVTILSGCGFASNIVAEGWVYYQKEIFYVPTTNVGVSPGIGYYLNASWTANPTDISPYQTVLSDLSQVSMHNQRTIVFSWSMSSNLGNLKDFTSWIPTRIVTDETNIATINTEITAMDAELATHATEIASINTSLSAIDPTGTIKMFGGSTSGLFDSSGLGLGLWTDWALCNGSNGTPDLVGKFIAGFDDSGSDPDYSTIGHSGGYKEITLTSAQSGLPVHNHAITDPGHEHNIAASSGSTYTSSGSDKIDPGGGSSAGYTVSAVTGISINNSTAADASTSHENRPPYYVLAYVMKIV